MYVVPVGRPKNVGRRLGSGANIISNIAIVDDHKLFLDGVTLLVRNMDEQFNVVGYDEPAKFLADIDQGQSFDLIICDLIMNTMNGLTFLSELQSRSDVAVLMLSGINTAPPLDEMKRVGAKGFVHKSAENDTLKLAVQTVLDGQSFFHSDGLEEAGVATTQYGDVERFEGSGPAAVTLTERQIEVLRLISQGATNREIAGTLTISENTVKSHLKQVFDVLQVNKRTACIRVAQARGLI